MVGNKQNLPPNLPDFWTKLIAGTHWRKTRFHDEIGDCIPLQRALRNTPRAVCSGILRLVFGHLPERPWISYDAQAILASHLHPRSRVLEFGSGMSTVWYARRSGTVFAIEDDRQWFEHAGRLLKPYSNVELCYVIDKEAYIGAAPVGEFDLIIIDGQYRDDCARQAISRLNEGGIIYLDNSDKLDSQPTGNVPEAVRILREFAAANCLLIREFTDFAPTQLHVQRGLMVGGSN